MRGAVAIAVTLFFYISVAAAATDIPEPKIQPGYVPEEARDELGIWMELEDYERAIQRSALLIDDPYINAYVRDVTCRVAREYCADLRIYVIRNPYFNASMTANGIVQVWTGLLVRVSSEDELAAVLGHELAHYTQLHTLERLRKAKRDMTTGSVFDMGLLLLTGVSVPVGQMTALASLMSFSREHESEADLLGARFMADAGYDPNAAAEVWEKIVAEEARAVAKRKEPNLFSQTHPSSSDRIVDLDDFVNANYPGRQRDPLGQVRHVEMLNEYYMMLMEDQLDTNRFGRTEVMLERHRKMGVSEELVHFFHGEMYRQRNEGSDLKFAKEAYSRATHGEKPVADAYLNLGYMFLKEGNLPQAQYNFRKYLELEPYADDRAMIEFYLEEK
jgi:predicted Zn-dependent protease